MIALSARGEALRAEILKLVRAHVDSLPQEHAYLVAHTCAAQIYADVTFLVLQTGAAAAFAAATPEHRGEALERMLELTPWHSCISDALELEDRYGPFVLGRT